MSEGHNPEQEDHPRTRRKGVYSGEEYFELQPVPDIKKKRKENSSSEGTEDEIYERRPEEFDPEKLSEKLEELPQIRLTRPSM